MHELYFIPNGTIPIYTSVLTPTEIAEHVQNTDLISLQQRWSSLWNS